MHSNEAPPQAPTTGPALLLQLGRLIVHRRSPSVPRDTHDRLLQAKLLAAQSQPSTSKQILTQPLEAEDPQPQIEAQLNDHVHSLWGKQIPICIDVLLAPNCHECYCRATKVDDELDFERAACHDNRCLLLERWTMTVFMKKNNETQTFITSQWLLNAIRSQLHFSQLSAWLARLKDNVPVQDQPDPNERRRKLSREQCNIKKLEANCDEQDLPKPQHQKEESKPPIKQLNIVYSIKVPGISYKMADFSRPPIDHTFPITDIGNNVYLKVMLQTLPRRDDIPTVKCCCQVPKRRASKEMTPLISDELALRLNDLTLGPPERQGLSNDLFRINSNLGVARKLSIFGAIDYSKQDRQENGEKKNCDKKKCDKIGAEAYYLVDDRMLTPCSENGKHRCSCDDESDNGNTRRLNLRPETKKLDERRLKEIAKYKRRLRKESKLIKFRDSGTSESATSEGDYGPCKKETHTSIPILQASRFDRFRAIGCYRNQTYLTLPASRMETKSPFIDTVNVIPTEYRKKSTSVGTQTDEPVCSCGLVLSMKCEECNRGMVRSEANYDLASLNLKVRKADDSCEGKVNKKLKCDIPSSKMCDKIRDNIDDNKVSIEAPVVSGIRKCPDDDVEDRNIIKRPKLRRFFPIVEKLDKVVNDRLKNEDFLNDVKDHKSKNGDVLLNKKDELELDQELPKAALESKVDGDKCVESEVPSPTEMDKFRWRFVSAASMVFHTNTGLPLTSSPAPLKRGNNCFDYDDSINGISGIKSALFQPIPPPSRSLPPSPAVTSPDPEPETTPVRSRRGPSAGLLGSFEESALKGRLEPVATVHGFTAEIGASGAFCPPHKKLPVTVFFYAPGGTNAPYMGHINLGRSGYRVSRSGTIQVSLLNPHGTLVKMFVVLYDLTDMPSAANTFLRQRTLYMPVGTNDPTPRDACKWSRYLIHLRFLTSKSGKLYLHTDIRIIVSRKSDLDTATAHSAILSKQGHANGHPSEVSYELRSFTYGPDNPKYSPR